MDKVGIVVLNWQQPKLTTATVDSLLEITHNNLSYIIYLVDNGSADDSVKIFQRKYRGNKNIVILETSKNLGYVGGNNYGIQKAINDRSDYVLVINNDVLVSPNFLSVLVNNSFEGKYGIVGPKIYFAKGHEFHLHRYNKGELGKVIWSAGGKMDWRNVLGSNIGVDEVDHGQFDKVNQSVDFISGCCMLVKTEVFKKIGLFDQKFFMYLEDTDFCQKAKLAGFNIAYIPQSRIWHMNAGSSSSGSQLHDYYITRNRLIFGIRYASLRAKIAIIRESFKFLITGSVVRRQAVIDFYRGHYGKK